MKLVARFSEPGSSVDFLRRVQERKVSLEEMSVDSERRTIDGVIRVANVTYHKQVFDPSFFAIFIVWQNVSLLHGPADGGSTRCIQI